MRLFLLALAGLVSLFFADPVWAQGAGQLYWQCVPADSTHPQPSWCPVSVTYPIPMTSSGAPPVGSGLANQASADSVSNLVFTATNKLLSSLTVKIGATSGYVMLFDAASLPANGAVTPKWCYPVSSDGTKGSVSAAWILPLSFSTGITAGFSTTGCDTLTASATAKFMGQAN